MQRKFMSNYGVRQFLASAQSLCSKLTVLALFLLSKEIKGVFLTHTDGGVTT